MMWWQKVWINYWVIQIVKQFNGEEAPIYSRLHLKQIVHKERILSGSNQNNQAKIGIQPSMQLFAEHQ